MPQQEIVVREIAFDEMTIILPLIQQLNPKLAPETLALRLEDMLAHGFRCIGAFLEEDLVGVSGFWTGVRFWCGKYIDIDNVIVDESRRSSGVGKKMMEWLENYAKEIGCEVAVLDSYVTYAAAHKFYFRAGYEIVGFHFIKKLEG